MNGLIRNVGLLAISGILSLGCAGTYYVESEPPPPQVEVRSVSPGATYVWTDGYWDWRRGNYVWVPGAWVRARPNRTWVPHRWESGPRGWYRVRGHWQ